MKRIKVIYGIDVDMMQESIDEWTKESNPEIISCSITADDKGNRYISTVYDDNKDLKI